MAGIARPDNDILIATKKEMTDYKLINSYCCNQGGNVARNLLDGIYGGYYGHTGFDFSYGRDYIQIKIDRPCNLYICLDPEPSYYNRGGSLNFTPSTYSSQLSLKLTTDWQLMIKNLKPGTYLITGRGIYCEWFFEEIINPSEKIKNSVKNAIINNELIQDYLIPYETVGDD